MDIFSRLLMPKNKGMLLRLGSINESQLIESSFAASLNYGEALKRQRITLIDRVNNPPFIPAPVLSKNDSNTTKQEKKEISVAAQEEEQQ